VPQSSRTLKSSIRISHTHNGSRKACVRKERTLKSQVCSLKWPREISCMRWMGIYSPHSKTSHWEDSTHLAVRPQFNSRSDHHSCNGYFQIQNPTVGGAGGLTGLGGGLTVSYTEVGSLTPLYGGWTTKVIVHGGQATKGSLIPLYF
jgi:hypothetical protein